jgi:hypothetical protein
LRNCEHLAVRKTLSDAYVVTPMLEAGLREDERDPEGDQSDGINARPAMAQVRKVAVRDIASEAHANQKRRVRSWSRHRRR